MPEDLIQEANAANGLTQTLAEFAGPAIATVLVLTLGTGAAFAIDAATFAVSAALLAALVRPRPRGETASRANGSPTTCGAGWCEVRTRPWVWVTIAVFALHMVLGYAPFVRPRPDRRSRSLRRRRAVGLQVAASVGLGTAAGALLALRWRPRRPMVVGILASIPFGLVLLVFALGAAAAGRAALRSRVPGVGLTLFGVWWETALAQRSPTGRTGSRRLLRLDEAPYALMPIGFVLIGVLRGRHQRDDGDGGRRRARRSSRGFSRCSRARRAGWSRCPKARRRRCTPASRRGRRATRSPDGPQAIATRSFASVCRPLAAVVHDDEVLDPHARARRAGRRPARP